MIQTIIFDVGDVLFGYRWKEMFAEHGIVGEEAARLAEAIFEDPLWAQLDLGNRPMKEILRDYTAKYPTYQKEITWFLTHCELMTVPREDVWEKVHALKQAGYGIYLLSNYPEELFRMHTKDAPFMNDINGMVVSYQIHKTKPDPVIYRYLLDKYRLKPEACLFFDDRPANTEAAEKLGIRSVTVTSEGLLLNELERLLSVKQGINPAFLS